jgi:hypothetical protein
MLGGAFLTVAAIMIAAIVRGWDTLLLYVSGTLSSRLEMPEAAGLTCTYSIGAKIGLDFRADVSNQKGKASFVRPIGRAALQKSQSSSSVATALPMT